MAIIRGSRLCIIAVIYFNFLVNLANAVELEFNLQPLECSSADCDRLVGFTLDPSTKRLYVVTQNTVKELDEGFKILREIKTSNSSELKNVLVVQKDSELLLCINNGTCELRDVKTLGLVGSGYRKGGVINTSGGSPIGWVDKGPGGENVLNIAVPNVNDTDRSMPLVASRNILAKKSDSSDEFFQYLKDDFSIPSSFFQPSSCLVDTISPVYGFSAGMYRFLLKLHRNESTSQVKIIRLCRESSTYRSYIELPIQCGDGKFRDVDQLIKASAYFNNDVLYISFTKRSGNDTITKVCAYDISEINDGFRQRRKECLEGKTESTELNWDRYNRCPSQPLVASQFNFSRLDDDDFCYDLPIAHPLGGNKPISQSALTLLTFNVTVTAIVVAPSRDTEDIVYLIGDNEGHVHRISGNRGKIDVPVDDGHAILSLVLNEDTLYVMTDRKVCTISLIEAKKVTDRPSSTQQNNHLPLQWTNPPPPIEYHYQEIDNYMQEEWEIQNPPQQNVYRYTFEDQNKCDRLHPIFSFFCHAWQKVSNWFG